MCARLASVADFSSAHTLAIRSAVSLQNPVGLSKCWTRCGSRHRIFRGKPDRKYVQKINIWIHPERDIDIEPWAHLLAVRGLWVCVGTQWWVYWGGESWAPVLQLKWTLQEECQQAGEVVPLQFGLHSLQLLSAVRLLQGHLGQQSVQQPECQQVLKLIIGLQ